MFQIFAFSFILGIALAEPWGHGGWGGHGGGAGWGGHGGSGGWGGWGRKRRSTNEIGPIEIESLDLPENPLSTLSKRSAEPWGRGGGHGGGWGWGK